MAALSLIAIVGITAVAKAQEHNHRLLPGCGTNIAVEQSLAANPHLRANMDALEQFTKTFAQQRNKRTSNQDTILIIPVVVHVIFDNDGSNISKAQVDNAMRIMNEDFSRTAPDTGQVTARFKPIHGNTRIEFRLASRDPQGNCTDGVTRTFSALTRSANDNVKQLISWPTNKYFNIWVVSSISFGAGGYAYYPGTAPRPEYEGVVVLASQFGGIGASGGSNFARRTMTHEAGHYLNLAHTWGSSNTPGAGNNCNIDDGVQDTPNTSGVTGQGCPLNQATCGPIANVENYMDYSNCGRMFTEGQSTRMRAAAFAPMGGRSNLWQQGNLIETGTADPYVPGICAPTAYFAPGVQMACSGSDITFTGRVFNTREDTTLNWTWVTQGAIRDTMIGKTVRFNWPTPGLKPVKLIISNPIGSDTVERAIAANIQDRTLGITTPFVESFEDPAFPNIQPSQVQNWQVSNDVNSSWRRLTASAVDGSTALHLPLLTAARGETYSLTSPRFAISSTALPVFNFAYAFAATNDTVNNVLRVSASSDCGATWQTVFSRSKFSNPNIVTQPNGNLQTAFVPQLTEWRNVQVNLNAWRNREFQLRIEYENATGNALWLDRLQLGQSLTSLSSTVNTNMLTFSPNPVKGSGEIICDGIEGKEALATVVSSDGRTVLRTSLQFSSNRASMDLSNLASGCYYVKLTSGADLVGQIKIVVLP